VTVATHQCALSSRPAERDSFSFDFLHEGLRQGDECLCLLSDQEHARFPGARQLPDRRRPPDFHPARDAFVRAGRFSASRMTEFLVDRAVRSSDDGFPRLRVMVEMDWLGQQSLASNDVLLYEAAVEHVVGQVPALILCLYDLHNCNVETLVRVLTGHETVYVDGSMLVNPHHRTGEDQGAAVLADQAQRSPAGAPRRRTHQTTERDRWDSLTDSELQIVAHVVAGLTNRQVAVLLVVSRHTVDAHLKNIFVKLDIHTRVELTVLALRHADKG
jgi:DNA-binding CsgD family transcriptional regulator